MAINTLADWRTAGAHARQSILGRARKEAGREPDREDEDEVQRSKATEHHIQTFFDALQAGDAAEQSHALAKIVDTWRADNNAGGLPVYAHQPLPSAFANELAKVVQSGPDGRPAAEGITAKLEPGARLSVFQQLREAASNQTRHTSQAATGHQNTAFAHETGDNNLTSPFVTAHARPRQPTYPGQAPQSTQQQGTRPKEPTWWKQKPLLPPEEGGEAALEPKPRHNGPFAEPKPLRQPEAGYEYGAWPRNPNARTETGSLLVSPSRLSQRQQENLMQRSWIHPTGKLTGAGRLKDGWGYFGAPRTVAKGPYHGGFDAPYKYPTDPDFDESGKPITYDRTVRLPTRAVCTGFTANSKSGTPINRLSFDLGDGITLELLHVQLTPALDAKIKAAQRSGNPLELDAGEILGDVDAGHDHTHIQLIASGPNGERWVVDPTYFMEKRARTFWREPHNDLVDSVIDLGRGAVDWTRRQFE